MRSVKEDQDAILSLPFDVQFKYKTVQVPRAGQPFTEATLDKYKTALLDMLKGSGFAYAKVTVTARGAAGVKVVVDSPR